MFVRWSVAMAPSFRDMRRGTSFSLNPMGAKIWQLLQKGVPEEQVIDTISKDFQPSRDSGQRRGEIS